MDLKKEIHNKSLELKKKIKELNNILSNLYNTQKINHDKKSYAIKRTSDRIDSASKNIENIKFIEGSGEADSVEIKNLHKETLKNILTLKDFYKNKLSMTKKGFEEKEVSTIKRNIDCLRLAYNDLSRIDVDLRSKDWDELEIKGKLLNE